MSSSMLRTLVALLASGAWSYKLSLVPNEVSRHLDPTRGRVQGVRSRDAELGVSKWGETRPVWDWRKGSMPVCLGLFWPGARPSTKASEIGLWAEANLLGLKACMQTP